MLSYQHAYHAGGPADVVKHALWALILQQLCKKEGAVHVYETHAGRGVYPVNGAEMQKTPEYLNGVVRLFPGKFPQEAAVYGDAVRALNAEALEMVPGSPAVAQQVLRVGDHLHLVEAHPTEMEHLKAAFPHAVRRKEAMHMHEGDGHKIVPMLVKPGQRTAVLIDPSYEMKGEYAQVVATVEAILARNPKATVMIWYPLIHQHRKHWQGMIEGLKALNVPATWLGHVSWNKVDSEGMYGTGQIVLNLPYPMESECGKLVRALGPLLKQKVADVTATMLVARA